MGWKIFNRKLDKGPVATPFLPDSVFGDDDAEQDLHVAQSQLSALRVEPHTCTDTAVEPRNIMHVVCDLLDMLDLGIRTEPDDLLQQLQPFSNPQESMGDDADDARSICLSLHAGSVCLHLPGSGCATYQGWLHVTACNSGRKVFKTGHILLKRSVPHVTGCTRKCCCLLSEIFDVWFYAGMVLEQLPVSSGTCILSSTMHLLLKRAPRSLVPVT